MGTRKNAMLWRRTCIAAMWYVSRFEWMKLQSALLFLTGFESMQRRHTHMHTKITFKFTTITIPRGERNVLEWKNSMKNKWNMFSGWAEFCMYYFIVVVAHIGCIVTCIRNWRHFTRSHVTKDHLHSDEHFRFESTNYNNYITESSEK